MKKLHTHYYLWLLLPFLPGCKKEGPRTTHIKGQVTEYGTDDPIAGARIYLLCDNSVIFGSSGSSLADSLVTDTDGRFDRTYAENELCGSLYLLPYKEGYFKGTEIDLTTDLKELDVVLDPETWLKVVTIPDGHIDHLLVSGDFLGAAGYDVWANQGVKETVFLNRGNRVKNIRWRPWGQINQTLQDSIYLTGHDTITYTIHY